MKLQKNEDMFVFFLLSNNIIKLSMEQTRIIENNYRSQYTDGSVYHLSSLQPATYSGGT
jgi:hypothetical protein